MATRIASGGNWRTQVRNIGRRTGAMVSALAVLAFALMIGFALASYSSTDPAMMTAAGGPVRNILGPAGAWGADLLLTAFGLPSVLLIPPLIVVALRLWRGVHPGEWKRALPITIVAMLLCDVGMGLVHLGLSSSLPAGAGGAIGLGAASLIDSGLAHLQAGWAIGIRIASVLLLGILGVTMALWSLGLDAEERAALFRRRDRAQRSERVAVSRPAKQVLMRATRAPANEVADEIDEPEPPRPTITTPAKPVSTTARTQRERQAKLDLGDTWVLPTLDLLSPPPPASTDKLDKNALERNARLLETVLEDFHVRGRITEVRPGPVVTMYELEPAAGIKASRVVALADDIARNIDRKSVV